MTEQKTGRIHSIQSLGTVDGPGVRFVVFFQGCPLRCGCCHNPDTWEKDAGKEITARELVEKAKRVRPYFGPLGGITLSGGEPLLQASFAKEIFSQCKEEGIHTCLDTSGCLINDEIRSLLDLSDRVLLDIKYTNDADYRRYAGCSLEAPLSFLELLEQKKISTTLRQVIIPTLNDSEESVRKLKAIADRYTCVDQIELLPFRKVCTVKYDGMGLRFPFEHLSEPTPEKMKALNDLL